MDNETIDIWTIQIANWRLAKRENIELLDTTAKSGIKEFAPNFSDVMKYKKGEMSAEEYTEIYTKRMRESFLNNRSVWSELKKKKRFAVACYCGKNQFCHRHLAVKMFISYLTKEGLNIKFHGELSDTA